MSAMPGADAAVSRVAPAVIVRALADGLRMLHAVPIAGCPFDRRLAITMAEARERTRLGLVDEGVDVLAELEAICPASEDLVFTHGDYCLPNVMVDPLGFIDCAARTLRTAIRTWHWPLLDEFF